MPTKRKKKKTQSEIESTGVLETNIPLDLTAQELKQTGTTKMLVKQITLLEEQIKNLSEWVEELEEERDDLKEKYHQTDKEREVFKYVSVTSKKEIFIWSALIALAGGLIGWVGGFYETDKTITIVGVLIGLTIFGFAMWGNYRTRYEEKERKNSNKP